MRAYRYDVWRKFPDTRIHSNKILFNDVGIWILDDLEANSKSKLFIPYSNIIHIIDRKE